MFTGVLCTVMPLRQQFQLETVHCPPAQVMTGWTILATLLMSSKPGKKYSIWPSSLRGCEGTRAVAYKALKDLFAGAVTLALSIHPLTSGACCLVAVTFGVPSGA
jgi:hypothetical protein